MATSVQDAADVERGDGLIAPSGNRFEVVRVDRDTVTVDTVALSDGTPLRLKNEQTYSKAELEACEGWRFA